MDASLRQKVIELRTNHNLSYSEIKNKLGVAKSTLSYWLKEFPLSKEKIQELRKSGWKKGEASRELFRETMRKRQEDKYLKIHKEQKMAFSRLSENEIFIAGLMLYAAEGDKKNYSRMVLSNTDPAILLFFIYWLGKYAGAQKKFIRIQLHLYENMDLKKEALFWSKELSIKTSQFYRPTIRKVKQNKYNYLGTTRHGTCSIYFLGVEAKRKVMMAIKAFFDTIKGV